jgi:methyltransferase-like protein/2-polyprenyl-3-methyl-5-hydroxy-6-metoxy-1,4-benzoquinol methylase
MTISTRDEFTRAIGAAYDETPYSSTAFPQTHPDKLCAMGRLFGLDAPAPARARVLELGCAEGANLLPMAQHAPHARFLGIDASAKQVESGQALIRACQLGNVEIRQQDLLEFGASEGKFDYIIAHGLFSWVPANVREKVLAICRDHLSENGVAFVSYNAFPGWGVRKVLRDMALYHTRALQDPKAKVQQARALVAILAASAVAEGSPSAPLLQQELSKLANDADDYVRHDLLGEINQPFYFQEFVDLAQGASLQYLSEPTLAEMLPSNFPPKTAETLRGLGSTRLGKEQYMDFIRNRSFRQTLLCHASQSLQRDISIESFESFYYTSVLRRADPGALHLQAGVAQDFTWNDGTGAVKLDSPFAKALFEGLAGAKLARVSYLELARSARAKAEPYLGTEEQRRKAAQEEAALGQGLAQLYARGLIDIFAERPSLQLSAPDKPAATALARYQAEHTHLVTNRVHDSIHLDTLARAVLMACNGERDRTGILSALAARAQAGTLKLSESGKPIQGEAKVLAWLRTSVAIALPKLADAGFF